MYVAEVSGRDMQVRVGMVTGECSGRRLIAAPTSGSGVNQRARRVLRRLCHFVP